MNRQTRRGRIGIEIDSDYQGQHRIKRAAAALDMKAPRCLHITEASSSIKGLIAENGTDSEYVVVRPAVQGMEATFEAQFLRDAGLPNDLVSFTDPHESIAREWMAVEAEEERPTLVVLKVDTTPEKQLRLSWHLLRFDRLGYAYKLDRGLEGGVFTSVRLDAYLRGRSKECSRAKIEAALQRCLQGEEEETEDAGNTKLIETIQHVVLPGLKAFCKFVNQAPTAIGEDPVEILVAATGNEGRLLTNMLHKLLSPVNAVEEIWELPSDATVKGAARFKSHPSATVDCHLWKAYEAMEIGEYEKVHQEIKQAERILPSAVSIAEFKKRFLKTLKGAAAAAETSDNKIRLHELRAENETDLKALAEIHLDIAKAYPPNTPDAQKACVLAKFLAGEDK